MKYISAKDSLPKALVEELQTYIQGGYIYVPALKEQPKRWGEVSGYRQELRERNHKIQLEYQKGTSIEALADHYCLSVHAIKKIIYQK